MLSEILFYLFALSILTAGIYAIEAITSFVVRLFKKKNDKTLNRYSEDEIRIAQYLEQKEELDKRYYIFRQMMHDVARKK